MNPSQPARVRLGWAFLCRCCSEVAVSALDTQLVVGPGLGMDIAQVAQVGQLWLWSSSCGLSAVYYRCLPMLANEPYCCHASPFWVSLTKQNTSCLSTSLLLPAQRELEKGRVKRLEFQQLVPESYGSLVVTHNLRWLWSGEGELAAEGVPEADAASVLRHLRSSVSGWAVEAPTPRTLVFQGEPDTEP